MRHIVPLITALALVLVLGFLVGRAYDYEYERLDQRVRQLEIRDCGIRQYEDFSVAPERRDDVRWRCIEAIGGYAP